MSIFWNMKSYNAFKYTIHNNRTVREKLIWKYYPVPGCYGHREIIGKRRGEILFDHFADRPQKSHGLYWRTHKEEYKAFLAHIKQ